MAGLLISLLFLVGGAPKVADFLPGSKYLAESVHTSEEQGGRLYAETWGHHPQCSN